MFYDERNLSVYDLLLQLTNLLVRALKPFSYDKFILFLNGHTDKPYRHRQDIDLFHLQPVVLISYPYVY